MGSDTSTIATQFHAAVEVEASTKLIEAIVTECNGIQTIATPAEHLAAGAALQRVTKLEKAIDLQRASVKKPYYETCKEIDELGRRLAAPLLTAKEQLADLIGAFEQTRDRVNSTQVADDNGVTVLQADGGTPYTKTTKKTTWSVVEHLVPPEYRTLMVDHKAIADAIAGGRLDPARCQWMLVKTDYKVSSR